MPRLKLQEKESYSFSTEYTVRVGDLNYAAHLGNAELTSLLHDARSRFFSSIGISEANLGDGATGIVIADLAVSFKGEIFLGEAITISCQIDEVASSGFRIFYCVKKKGQTAVLAETGIVAFNYQTRTVSRVPDSFLKII